MAKDEKGEFVARFRHILNRRNNFFHHILNLAILDKINTAPTTNVLYFRLKTVIESLEDKGGQHFGRNLQGTR